MKGRNRQARPERRNQAARARATADPEGVADAALQSEALASALSAGSTWTLSPGSPGRIDITIRTRLDEDAANRAMRVRDVAGALWLRSRANRSDGPPGFDSLANAKLICDGLARLSVGDGLAALTLLVESLPVPVEPYRPVMRASLPKFHRVTEDEAARLPGFPRNGPAPGEQLDLPGFRDVVHGCPSWLLWMYDRAGGESMAAGRGAPWSLRLFIGALIHVAVHDRTGTWVTMRIPNDGEPATAERPAGIHTWLHPDGWTNLRRDWERLPAALDTMRERLAYVPVPGIGSVMVMAPTVIPRARSDPFVEFTVRIPTSAAHGARIDWTRLRRYGKESAGLYRAYLSVMAWLDGAAHRGHPVTREIHPPLVGPTGKPLRAKGGRVRRDQTELVANPLTQYVAPLTEQDLTRMVGFDPSERKYRQRARQAFERLHEDGVIDLVAAGKAWRIFGPPKPGAS